MQFRRHHGSYAGNNWRRGTRASFARIVSVGLSPTDADCEAERNEGAGQRSGSLTVAEWSGVQRAETDGVRAPAGRAFMRWPSVDEREEPRTGAVSVHSLPLRLSRD